MTVPRKVSVAMNRAVKAEEVRRLVKRYVDFVVAPVDKHAADLAIM